MPFEYGTSAGQKKERKSEEVEIISVGAQPTARKGEYQYVKFSFPVPVEKDINGEKKKVLDGITVFGDNRGIAINWDRDMPSVVKLIDDKTREKKVVKVKVVYYVGDSGDKRARFGDLEQWEYLGERDRSEKDDKILKREFD